MINLCFSLEYDRISIFLNPPSGFNLNYYVGDVAPPNQVFYNKRRDLAIIALAKAIDPQAFGKGDENTKIIVKPVCLPKIFRRFDWRYKPATYFGWGIIGVDKDTDVLQKAEIEVNYETNSNWGSHFFVQRKTGAPYPCQVISLFLSNHCKTLFVF